MKKNLVLLIGLVFSYARPSLAGTYDCKISYEFDHEFQTGLTIDQSTVFSTTDTTYSHIHREFQNHKKRNVSINLNENKEIEIQMGDFCGDNYQKIILPHNLNADFKSSFSFGRDDVSGLWGILHLSCIKR